MEAGALLGVRQSWCDVRSIRFEEGRVLLDAYPILGVQPDRMKNSMKWGPLIKQSPTDFTQLQYRVDPPINLSYLHPLQLLKLSIQESKKTQIINPLSVLLAHNEKFEAASIKHMMPPSLVSSQWDYLVEFGRKEGRTVLKPLHEAQSHGIELLTWENQGSIDRSKKILFKTTEGFQTPVILQKYLTGITEGEIRLWFLDGKLLASVKKLPLQGDFRVNMDRGSQLAAHRLTRIEKTQTLKIARHLRKMKIRLAAIDLIDSLVTDFNFTSPGLIPQMETLLGENLARTIVKALAR